MAGTAWLEGAASLALGFGAGVGLLFATGDLKGAAAIERLEAEKGAAAAKLETHARETQRRQGLQAAYDAELARRKAAAEERARAEAAAQAAAVQAEADAKAKAEAEAAAQAARRPANGVLSIKDLSGDLDVDAGPGLSGKGKSVDLAFEKALPAKIKLKSGAFKIELAPKGAGKQLAIDVTVSPLAIITAEGARVGTSAQGLAVGGKPFKLDFQSPNAGELKLLLTFRK